MQIDAPFVWNAIGDLGLGAALDNAERPSRVAAANVSTPDVSEAKTEAPPEIPWSAIDTQCGATLPAGLTEFPAESDSPASPVERSGMQRWLAGAAAAFLVVSASVGAVAWYTGAETDEGQAVTVLVPPPPAPKPSEPVVAPPRVEALPAPAAQATQTVQPAPAGRAAAPAAAVPSARRGYSILVASFENRERAERLVEELTNAGFGAHAVERNGGAAQERFTLVRVTGYTSALDVQRDLQRIRELPGGYSDARVVEQQ
jgi:cell division septation protein DedD